MIARLEKIVPKTLLLLSVLALAACGGNDGSSSTSSTATAMNNGGSKVFLQGQVADGYLDKALVFLDRNGNKVADPDEPQTNTGPGGHFKLLVLATDADQYPVLAQVVPGQTFDEDTGNRLTNPMTLEAPVGQYQFISPMTTLVKNALDKTPGLTPAQAQLQVQAAFSLGGQVPLNSDYIAAEQSSDPQQAAEALRLHVTAQTAAAIMSALQTDISANLGGTIPATRTAAVQALLTDIAMTNANKITTALEPTAANPAPTPQEAAAGILAGIDPTTLDESLLALYQQRPDQQNPLWGANPPPTTPSCPTARQPRPRAAEARAPIN